MAVGAPKASPGTTATCPTSNRYLCTVTAAAICKKHLPARYLYTHNPPLLNTRADIQQQQAARGIAQTLFQFFHLWSDCSALHSCCQQICPCYMTRPHSIPAKMHGTLLCKMMSANLTWQHRQPGNGMRVAAAESCKACLSIELFSHMNSQAPGVAKECSSKSQGSVNGHMACDS